MAEQPFAGLELVVPPLWRIRDGNLAGYCRVPHRER
jgi:hypothetical protein